MTIAVIFVPAVATYATHAAHCFMHCAAQGYHVLGVPIPGDWASAAKALMTGTATVLVVARPDHLDPRREPRIEIAGQPAMPVAVGHNNAGPVPQRHRRPNQV